MSNLIKVKIDVTQEHIDKGVCVHAQKCAVSNSLNTVFEKCNMGNCQDRVHFYSKGMSEDYFVEFPKDLTKWIYDFDAFKEVKPISYLLELDPVKFDFNLEQAINKSNNMEVVSN